MGSLKRLLEMPFSGRQNRLANSRPAMSKERFVDAIASSGQGRMAAEVLWDKLVEARVCDRFTPYPDDDLLKVFGLAEEDLDEDVFLEIIEATGSSVRSAIC